MDTPFLQLYSQPEMFKLCGSKLVSATLAGQNGCLFTYGASGSGKTYTMMGGAGENAGLLPRTLESLFSAVSANLYQKTDIRPTGSAFISRVGMSEEKSATKLKSQILTKVPDEECNSGDWNSKRRSSLLRKELDIFRFFYLVNFVKILDKK